MLKQIVFMFISSSKTVIMYYVNRDGAWRSGVVCCCSSILDMMKAEQTVDIFSTVRTTRLPRSQLIPTLVSNVVNYY